jgi:hypothetical protein
MMLDRLPPKRDINLSVLLGPAPGCDSGPSGSQPGF